MPVPPNPVVIPNEKMPRSTSSWDWSPMIMALRIRSRLDFS
eukprot:CAMPEP_0196181500 /NCGR_PEP_ID=MMETSP0911-20130528/27073_1 /TAXON_ID=49265 /ORGANISM="Thalassiosira rotula, Strain GSO102" /LENGTH=40 /DNA_ID= /DNA_START= /DNA_END= /DNA_ORIENTATION=